VSQPVAIPGCVLVQEGMTRQWEIAQDCVHVEAVATLGFWCASRHAAADLFGNHHGRPTSPVEHVRTALVGHTSYMSDGATADAMAQSASGRSRASSHCVPPRYDPPKPPTTPLDHGWAAAQAIVSAPSRGSWKCGVNSPSEPK
jgi:hypothetical protein